MNYLDDLVEEEFSFSYENYLEDLIDQELEVLEQEQFINSLYSELWEGDVCSTFF